jgi:hypothetical protein
LLGVNYVLAAAIAAMWIYIVWLTLRLRGERVRTQRQQTRGRFAFRRKDRIRFLLGRAFKDAPDRPDWEDPLLARLGEVSTNGPPRA